MTDNKALVAEAKRMSLYVQRGGPDDGTVYDRLAAALEKSESDLAEALGAKRRWFERHAFLAGEVTDLRQQQIKNTATVAAVLQWRHNWFSEPVVGAPRAAHVRRLDAILDGTDTPND